jgi:hypothetical protein
MTVKLLVDGGKRDCAMNPITSNTSGTGTLASQKRMRKRNVRARPWDS